MRWLGQNEVVLLGSAGQRFITAGDLLCVAGASAGCHATQKNDYPITVIRGHSVSKVILFIVEIDDIGIENSSVVVALAPEGVSRRKKMFAGLSKQSVIIKAAGAMIRNFRGVAITFSLSRFCRTPRKWGIYALPPIA